MKTLVIHPDDRSTDFLKIIYGGKGYTIINDCSIDREELKQLIKEHDRIIMLGHGTPRGLLNPAIRMVFNNKDKPFEPYIIDDSFVDILKEKQTISIWCNSDAFYKQNGLHDGNLHTGMIISEVAEANMVLGYSPLNRHELLDNMYQFAEAAREAIELTGEEQKQYMLDNYTGNDDITLFNRSRIYII